MNWNIKNLSETSLSLLRHLNVKSYDSPVFHMTLISWRFIQKLKITRNHEFSIPQGFQSIKRCSTFALLKLKCSFACPHVVNKQITLTKYLSNLSILSKKKVAPKFWKLYWKAPAVNNIFSKTMGLRAERSQERSQQYNFNSLIPSGSKKVTHA